MNYLIQIKAFYDRLELNPLNSSEVALWHALMSINNKTAWSDKFTVAASVLCQKSGMKSPDKSSNFFKARNGLTQAGLITWKSRKGNQAAEYSITKLYNDLPTHSVGNSVDSSVGSSVGNGVDSSVALNKHKHKHKQNKTLRPKRKKRVYDPNSDYFKLADYMVKRIRDNKPDYKEPNLQKWADCFRKIIEIDKRDKHETALLIKWVQQDSFEQTNVLSPDKLRKRYDQLAMKMNKDNGFESPEPQVSKKPKPKSKWQIFWDIYYDHGSELDKAIPAIQDKYPGITPDEIDRVMNPDKYKAKEGNW